MKPLGLVKLYWLIPVIWSLFALLSVKFPGGANITRGSVLLPGFLASSEGPATILALLIMGLSGVVLHLIGVTPKRFCVSCGVGVALSAIYIALEYYGSRRILTLGRIISDFELNEAQSAVSLALLFWIWGLYLGIIVSALGVIVTSLRHQTPVGADPKS